MKLGPPSASSGIFRADDRGNHVFVDSRWCEIAGLSQRQAVGEGWLASVSPDDRDRVIEQWSRAVESKMPFQSEYHVTKSGALVVSRAELAAGRPAGFIGTLTDMSSMRERQIKLEYSVAQLAATIEGMRDGVLVLDRLGRQQLCNGRFLQLLGAIPQEPMSAEGLNACLARKLKDPRHANARIGDLYREAALETEAVLELKSGGTLLLSSRPQRVHGCHVGRVFNLRDISEVKRTQTHLARRAYHDPLTGLPNRYLLSDRMAQAIAHSHRENRKLAVLFIDLDHFKKINDRVGHLAADRMLKETATRMSKCVREADTVARMGGDEFIVLLHSITQLRDAGEVAQKILASLAMPFDDDARISASIGIATLEHAGEDGEAVLQRADAAMYYAKRCGRGRYRYHTKRMSESAA